MKAQLTVKGYSLTMFPGDFSSLWSLFFDNLSTILTVSGVMTGVLSADIELANKIVMKRMVPACGVMLFVGNVYYAFQAARLTKEKGRQYTAQPYGLNTSGAFPFIFSILAPIASGSAFCSDNPTTRVETAYQVGVAANFLTGIINIVLGLAGHHVLRLAPMAAFLTPISGIGIIYLSIGQIIPNMSAPLPGLLPIFMCFFAYYSGCLRNAQGQTRFPEALQMVIPALIISYIWQEPVFSPDGVDKAIEDFEAGSLYWATGDIIKGFEHMGDYIGIVLPISLLASMGDIMVLVSAQKAGDAYNVRETMISDGVGTLIGALLGSPIGTVVYIGHPIHKANGAGNGYSLMNGIIYLILTLSGVYGIVKSLIPMTATGPIIMIFGLMITEQAFEAVKRRHWPAVIFGLFFFVQEWAGADDLVGDGSVEGEIAGYNSGFYGKTAMLSASPLHAIIWTSIITYTIDRRWDRVGLWCVVAAVLSAMGIIHQTKALVGPKLFANGVFAAEAGCSPVSDALSEEAKEGYGPTSPMCFMFAYLLIGAVAGASFGMNMMGFRESFPDPVYEEGIDDVFDNWDEEPALAAPEAKEVESEEAKATL